MKKFRFRLQKILDLQKQKEKYQVKEFAKSLKNKQILSNELANIHQMKKQNIINLQQKQVNNFDSNTYRIYMNYSEQLNKNIRIKQIDLSKAEQHFNIEKNKLMQLMQKTKIYEKLRDKNKENYLYKVKKFEEKFLDEINQIKYKK